ncbi:MAG: pyridoxal-phosphate dependent enzyme, partial [Rikenellaceae bacterium]
SNAAGTIFHYLDEPRVKINLVEADGLGTAEQSAATMKFGSRGIIHGAKTMLMQDEDGQITEPYSISAGLDYPGVGPLHAHLATTGRSEILAVTDDEALAAAFELTRLEGIIPALESAHALGVLPKLRLDKDEVVVLTLSGRGDKDMQTYIGVSPKFI